VQEDVDEVAEDGQRHEAQEEVGDHDTVLRPGVAGSRGVDARLTPLDAFLTTPALGSGR
jgi:hypothetical protein